MTEDVPKKRPVAIFGAGGHGLLLGSVLVGMGDRVVFLDDRMDAMLGVDTLGCLLVGGSEKLKEPRFLRQHDLFIGIGNNEARRKFTSLAIINGASLAALVDPDASILVGASFNEGTVIMAGAVISHGSKLGRSVIVNTCASVAHDCWVGDYVNICDGARLTGGVTIGDMAYIGAGAVILPKVRVGYGAIVGAGAVVTKDVPDGHTVIGNPGRSAKSDPDSEALLSGSGDNIVKIVPGV